MNPEQPQGTRRPRSPLTTNISPEVSDSVVTISPTTDQVIKKPRVVSSPDYTPTAPSIHQPGKDAFISVGGGYDDMGRDVNIIYEGRKPDKGAFTSVGRVYDYVGGDQYIINQGCKL